MSNYVLIAGVVLSVVVLLAMAFSKSFRLFVLAVGVGAVAGWIANYYVDVYVALGISALGFFVGLVVLYKSIYNN